MTETALKLCVFAMISPRVVWSPEPDHTTMSLAVDGSQSRYSFMQSYLGFQPSLPVCRFLWAFTELNKSILCIVPLKRTKVQFTCLLISDKAICWATAVNYHFACWVQVSADDILKYFSYFPRKKNLALHADCLLRRQFI